MRQLKISVIGNSVAMRVRPPQQYPYNNNYTYLLEKSLNDVQEDYSFQVNNLAYGGELVREAIYNIDKIIRVYPNYYILNFGVNDASTREAPHWFYKLANTIVKNWYEYIFSGIYANLFKKYRPFFVKIRRYRSWISEKDFINQYDILVATLIKDTNARIISLPINNANDRVEKQLPGSAAKYIKYNEHIKNITNKYNQIFIDTNSFINQSEYPDGIHYSHKGHKLLAIKLKEIILKDLKDQ